MEEKWINELGDSSIKIMPSEEQREKEMEKRGQNSTNLWDNIIQYNWNPRKCGQ